MFGLVKVRHLHITIKALINELIPRLIMLITIKIEMKHSIH